MSWLGRGQWLFLVFLWWVVAGNFERIVVDFTPQRLVTEGVIHLNAVLCTLLVVIASAHFRGEPTPVRTRLGTTTIVGLLAATLCVILDWGVVRIVHGDRYAGKPYSGLHIRFGPNATTNDKFGR